MLAPERVDPRQEVAPGVMIRGPGRRASQSARATGADPPLGPTVPSHDKLDGPIAIGAVSADISRHAIGSEVIERREEVNGAGPLVDKVLQEKEVDVTDRDEPLDLRLT